MSEADWLEEEAPPRRKSKLPKWLMLGCGCGCLVVFVAAAALALVWFRAVDPERQWPRVEELLAFDERPDLEVEMGMPFAIAEYEQIVLLDPEEHLQATLQSFGADAPASTLDPLFLEDQGAVLFGLAQPVDTELGEIEIQGRTVRALRFGALGGLGELVGPGIRIDLSHGGRCLSVQLTRIAPPEGGERADRLDDEVVRAFFEPFDVWRSE